MKSHISQADSPLPRLDDLARGDPRVDSGFTPTPRLRSSLHRRAGAASTTAIAHQMIFAGSAYRWGIFAPIVVLHRCCHSVLIQRCARAGAAIVDPLTQIQTVRALLRPEIDV